MAESSSESKHGPHQGKTFDVSHPGRSAPSATSRPVIIGHGPMMHDPMVNTAKSDESEGSSVVNTHSVAEKTIEAPESLKATEPEVTDKPEESNEPDEPAALVEEKPSEAPTGSSTVDNDEAVVDSVAEQAADKKQQSDEDKKAVEKAAHTAELVANKSYFVPINVAKRRRSNRAALIVIGSLVFGVLAGLFVYISGTL